MNQIDKNPEYKKIYNFVKNKFDKTNHFKHGPFDETFFTLRVYESAKDIINKLNKKVMKEQVLVASILHDIGKIKLKPSKIFKKNNIIKNASEEWHKHSRLSIPIAEKYLRKLGHSENFIKNVSYLIENHDLRGSKTKNKSIELKILQDADLIADIGFAGFIRPFLFSGKFNKQSIINSIKKIQNYDRTKGCSEINLNEAKIIAEKEMKIQKYLAKEISKEIESDLL
ncbi:MAG: HD domain-containing protein [Nanobdellota archaeon]